MLTVEPGARLLAACAIRPSRSARASADRRSRSLSNVQRSPLRLGSVRCSRRLAWSSAAEAWAMTWNLSKVTRAFGQVVGDPFDEGGGHVDTDRAHLRGPPLVLGQVVGEA